MLATAIAMGVAVLSASSPAQAGSEISGPGTVTSGSSVTVSAQIDNVVRVELQVAAPGGGFTTIDSGGNLLGETRLSNRVNVPSNGIYKTRLRGSVTGKIYETKNFTVRVPPSAPRGVRASASGGKVVVRWARGAEDDLAGYEVAASARSRTAAPSALCAGAACTTTLSLPSGASGQVGVSVRALRPDGSGGTVRSGASSSRVTIPAGPSGSRVYGQGADGSGPRSGATGVPSLDPLNPLQNNSSIEMPPADPGGTSGFEYPAPGPEVAAPGQADPAAENVSATSSLEWGKSLAIALILLVVAAHLGMWTRRTRVAQALVGRGGRTGAGRERVRAARERIARAEAEARAASAGAAATPAGDTNGAAAPVPPGARRNGTASPAKPPAEPPARARSAATRPRSGPGARDVSRTGAAKVPSRRSGGYQGRRRRRDGRDLA